MMEGPESMNRSGRHPSGDGIVVIPVPENVGRLVWLVDVVLSVQTVLMITGERRQ